MKNQRIVPAIIATCLSAGCATPNMVTPSPTDASAPNPVEIHGKLTGGGGESNHGAQAPLDAGPLTVLQNVGQLEITSTATDNDSGIKSFEIYSNDRHCNWNNGSWVSTGPEPTKSWDFKTITPDSSGKVSVTAVALANIQVAAELGTFDKVTWQFFGTATNFAGKSIIIGPITYTAVTANVPAANRTDGCP